MLAIWYQLWFYNRSLGATVNTRQGNVMIYLGHHKARIKCHLMGQSSISDILAHCMRKIPNATNNRL